jgi:putative (di)nucleoside polyphosphate hydrolase
MADEPSDRNEASSIARGGAKRDADALARRESAAAGSGGSPAHLSLLLAEPEIQLIMRADGVDEQELLATLTAIAAGLASERSRQQAVLPEGMLRHDPYKYRQGVGVVLLNKHGEVFVACRRDVDDAWQMPQGGIDPGESPQAAALRELKEEIGTNDVDVIAESQGWIYYDVPAALATRAWGDRWRGQRQKWFVMLFKGADCDIDLATADPEFNEWRWAARSELAALVVSFKRELYRSVLAEFDPVLVGKGPR